MTKPRYALISVSDKSRIQAFAQALQEQGFTLLSTGGSAKALAESSLEVTEVSSITGFPEIMGGRVKTLHPKIHGGLLGRRDIDQAVMEEHQIPQIDILVLNLYPFEQTIAKPDCSFEDAIENIDIGGPAMLRAAAKNFAHVAVVTSPNQYDDVIEALKKNAGQLTQQQHFELSVAAFNHVARYDDAISDYMSGYQQETAFPRQSNQCFSKKMDLRYGENPHQQAAYYQDLNPQPGSLVNFNQHQGKALSFNNIADADAAWETVRQFEQPSCVIVKHANPCGVAQADNLQDAYDQAFHTDSTSAFGGIIAFNQTLDAATAETIVQRQFLEVLLAPAYEPAALDVLASKKNVRVLEVPVADYQNSYDIKRVGSGLLIQTADQAIVTQADCRVVTDLQPSDQQWQDLLFAWKVAKMVKSNAIVYAGKQRSLGIGAGQMSRVDSARIARWKAQDAGLSLEGAAMASDAFFPFRDGIDTAAEAGIKAVIQPGGSMRDEEVIQAANEHGMTMVFTGIRHFRH